MAPRKVRAIAGIVRGMSVNEAEAQLMYHRRRASKPILKLLRSGVAGAVQKKLDPATLYISEIRVDQGPMLKRFLPRARGSASPIQKKMSHVTLTLGVSATPKPNRFTIVAKKKTKHLNAPEKPSRAKKQSPATEERTEEKSEAKHQKQKEQSWKPNVLKRVFGRRRGLTGGD